jgi:hypothetical protein
MADAGRAVLDHSPAVSKVMKTQVIMARFGGVSTSCALVQTEKAALKAVVVSMQVALPFAYVHSRYHSRFHKNV